jgi:hypothetical protein
MSRAGFFIAALLLAAIGAFTPARASGPFLPGLRFYSYSGVDADGDTAYFKGRLGIIRPTFDENRLYAAYRILLGQTLTDAQAQQLLASCCDIRPPSSAGEMQNGWLEIRGTVTPEKPEPDPDPYRQTKDYWRILNCYPSAFETAAATLKTRIATYGAKDRWLIEWVKGQDAVFANCSQVDLSLPAADLEAAPNWLKADRAYQVAAAYFYHWDYAEARQRFATIAKDPSSPWAPIAPYLAARAVLRLAGSTKTSEAMIEAQQEIAAIKPDDKFGIAARDIANLSSALAFLQPDRIKALEQALLAPSLPDDLATTLHDFLLLADNKDAGQSDLGDWIHVMQVSNSDASAIGAAKENALNHWRRTPTLPWLIATLTYLGPGDADVAAAIEQSRKLEPSAPGFLDAAWQRIRLLISQHQSDTARVDLDKILADKGLTVGTRNLFLIERARVAGDWDEFARFAPRRPEFLGPYFGDQASDTGDFVSLPMKSIDKSYAAMLGWRSELLGDPRYFDTDGATILNSAAPLAVQAKLVSGTALPDNMRRDLALAAWTRAVLLGREEIAKSIAELLAAVFPQYGSDWQGYREASSVGERKFAAAVLLLRLPAAGPWVEDNLGYTYKRDVIGSYASRWWSPESLKTDGELAAIYFNGPCRDSCAMPGWLGPPAFVSDSERRTAEEEFARIKEQAPSAADYLGGIVLDWAKAHADDPRLPEALHLVVRLTQFGDAGNSGISRRAYNLLHTAYSKSPWTKQTPFWYGK